MLSIELAFEKRLNHPDIFWLKADKFLAFIETEIIPYLEKNYSISDNGLLSGFRAGGSLYFIQLLLNRIFFKWGILLLARSLYGRTRVGL